MKIAKYKNKDGQTIQVSYDENAPCLVCGEPVLSPGMGGTDICGSCDMGKCRYCGMTIFVLKEKIDNGESKRVVLKHMKWHKEHTPDIVKGVTNVLRRM